MKAARAAAAWVGARVAAWVGLALNPARYVFGPIFQKEIRTAGRRAGVYWLRMLYSASLLGLATLMFIAFSDGAGAMTSVGRMQMLQSLAPYLTVMVAWAQFAAMALVGPLMTASAISEEKRAGTLSALLTTPLTSGQIVLGKLSSRLVQLVILVLLGAPILLAVRVFGGLDAAAVLAATAVALSTGVLGAALGLMYSVRHRRATTAALFAIFTLAVVQCGPIGIEWMRVLRSQMNADYGRGAGASFREGFLTTSSPAVMVVVSVGQMSGGAWGLATPVRTLWLVNVGYNLALAGGVLVWTTASLRRAMRADAGGEGAAAAPTAKRLSRKERAAEKRRGLGAREAAGASPVPGGELSSELDPSPSPLPRGGEAEEEGLRFGGKERMVGDQPVLWRELRQSMFGSRRLLYVSVAIVGAALLLIYSVSQWREWPMHGVIGVLGALGTLFMAVFLTTGSISGEREARTWEVLLTTPLSARQVLLGKFLGTLRGQWLGPGVVAAHVLVFTAMGVLHPGAALLLGLIFTGPILMLTATGVVFSLVFRKSVTASVLNLALGLVLWVVSWPAAAMLSELFGAWGRRSAIEDTVFNTLFVVNPVAMTVSTMYWGVRGGWMHSGPGQFELSDGRVGPAEFALLALAAFAGYAVVAAGALGLGLVFFRRLAGRAS